MSENSASFKRCKKKLKKAVDLSMKTHYGDLIQMSNNISKTTWNVICISHKDNSGMKMKRLLSMQ